jgi:hypothetical protein
VDLVSRRTLVTCPDPFCEWARIGVPVRLFPRWLRCSDTRRNRLAPVESGLFDLLNDPWRPEHVRYVHGCRGHGQAERIAGGEDHVARLRPGEDRPTVPRGDGGQYYDTGYRAMPLRLPGPVTTFGPLEAACS